MSETTFEYLTDVLIGEIALHPHQEELLSIMQEQLIDDTNVYNQNLPWFFVELVRFVFMMFPPNPINWPTLLFSIIGNHLLERFALHR